MAIQMARPKPTPHQTCVAWSALLERLRETYYTDLSDELFVCCRISLGAKGLLQESKQDRNDDACFEALSEADEEDCADVSYGSYPSSQFYSLGTANTFTMMPVVGGRQRA